MEWCEFHHRSLRGPIPPVPGPGTSCEGPTRLALTNLLTPAVRFRFLPLPARWPEFPFAFGNLDRARAARCAGGAVQGSAGRPGPRAPGRGSFSGGVGGPGGQAFRLAPEISQPNKRGKSRAHAWAFLGPGHRRAASRAVKRGSTSNPGPPLTARGEKPERLVVCFLP